MLLLPYRVRSGKRWDTGQPDPNLPTTWEETRTLAPVGLLATDPKEAEGTVVHTLAVLTDTFPADEQEEPLLAGGTAVLLGAYDAAGAVASQTSDCCSQTRWERDSHVTYVRHFDGLIRLFISWIQ